MNEFERTHNQFINDWNSAMNTGETTALEKMNETYYVAFFYNSSEKPSYFTKEESIEGMKKSIDDLRGAKKRFENRLIRMKDEQNAVVFYELVIDQNGESIARLFTIENWIKKGASWLLANEIQQSI
ncbi:hypothetical protein JCM19046_1403 [Bacillus sp. JCM 19046]|uniref:DUF4440 domain-containing protein n=1 Tax=Shouchella xiaoxiensis TaxID=766895 RepID=A0ABS2SP36_9BACI|nr:hypothetical protein [Shouchella xiaoxiensis]MBM7837284.1 hypothetical protein [Shouchella xiaoxiensis]GAF11474.1 hypothetical protein JCM19045_578 [Bacillus sp. JCM 19045]GAF16937.1 hypothetical protein JCM19046_1403 [Bacillus sp. JCM 19046]